MTKIVPLLRNPYCIFITRNPVAIAERLCSQQKRCLKTVALTAKRVLQEFSVLLDQYTNCVHPKVLLSFDRIIRRPQIAVKICCKLLNLRPSAEQWCSILSHVSRMGGYR